MKAVAKAKAMGLKVKTDLHPPSEAPPTTKVTFHEVASAPYTKTEFDTPGEKSAGAKQSEAMLNMDWRNNRRGRGNSTGGSGGAPPSAPPQKTEFTAEERRIPKKLRVDTVRANAYGNRSFREPGTIDHDFILSAPATKKEFDHAAEDDEDTDTPRRADNAIGSNDSAERERALEISLSADGQKGFVRLEALTPTTRTSFEQIMSWGPPHEASLLGGSFIADIKPLGELPNGGRPEYPDAEVHKIQKNKRLPAANPDARQKSLEKTLNYLVEPRSAGLPPEYLRAEYEEGQLALAGRIWQQNVAREAASAAARSREDHICYWQGCGDAKQPDPSGKSSPAKSKNPHSENKSPHAENKSPHTKTTPPKDPAKVKEEQHSPRFKALLGKLHKSAANRQLATKPGASANTTPAGGPAGPKGSKGPEGPKDDPKASGASGVAGGDRPRGLSLNPLAAEFSIASSDKKAAAGTTKKSPTDTTTSRTLAVSGEATSAGSDVKPQMTGDMPALVQSLVARLEELQNQFREKLDEDQGIANSFVRQLDMLTLSYNTQLEYLMRQHGGDIEALQARHEEQIAHYNARLEALVDQRRQALDLSRAMSDVNLYGGGPGFYQQSGVPNYTQGAGAAGFLQPAAPQPWAGYQGPANAYTNGTIAPPPGFPPKPSGYGPGIQPGAAGHLSPEGTQGWAAPYNGFPGHQQQQQQQQHNYGPPPVPHDMNAAVAPHPATAAVAGAGGPNPAWVKTTFGPKPVRKPKGPFRPGDPSQAMHQQAYEEYLENMRASNPGYAIQCKQRQLRRADRQRASNPPPPQQPQVLRDTAADPKLNSRPLLAWVASDGLA
ncbi:hypothetical protein F4780DRAFT_115430 [Xylariomycetidae sp. FL0641]|nr:hypothetical protein F4780DRAFT_115430 [Xylariomycetidae sp. FL0641]